jgi:hypothetical protein
LNAFDWPGVGALKPVLTVPRIPTLSMKRQLPATLKLVVVPKSSKSS